MRGMNWRDVTAVVAGAAVILIIWKIRGAI